jgi:hypothetical protein
MSDEKRMDEAEFLRIFRSLPDGLPVDAEKALADWKRARAQESALRAEVETLRRLAAAVTCRRPGPTGEVPADGIRYTLVPVAQLNPLLAALHPSAPTPATEAKPVCFACGMPIVCACCSRRDTHRSCDDAGRAAPPETTETRGEEP